MPPAALWVADVGSTFLKAARFDRPARGPLPEPAQVFAFHSLDGALDALAAGVGATAPVWRTISVRRAEKSAWRLGSATVSLRPTIARLTHRDLPLTIDVDFPERVGVDRLAAAVAANVLRAPERAAIVVDSGTAITVDLVDAHGVFRGGAILPGVRLMSQSLHRQTDVLPEVTLRPGEPPPPACGRNTQAALESGLFWGLVGSVKELIAQLTREVEGPPQVLLSGGDGQLIAAVLGASHVRAAPRPARRGAGERPRVNRAVQR